MSITEPASSSDDDDEDNASIKDAWSVQSCSPNQLVQNLGHLPGEDLVSNIAKIQIENSSDVHFGDKNIYRGPVTIKQIVYANGDASPTSPDKVEENTGAEVRKGFLWLQNVSKHRPIEIGVFVGVLVLFVTALVLILVLKHPPGVKAPYSNGEPDLIKPSDYAPDLSPNSHRKLRLVSRYEWVAQPPVNQTTPLVTPVPYVIIHHTATENCSSQSQCVFHVRYIQTFHIESKGWFDIGYNFLVGGDGAAYEGRGWTVEGAHTLGWNFKSIGIAFVGTFNSEAPPDIQILACKRLIALGVEQGYIQKGYTVLAARQLFGTESPGAALLKIIKQWPEWLENPKD